MFDIIDLTKDILVSLAASSIIACSLYIMKKFKSLNKKMGHSLKERQDKTTLLKEAKQQEKQADSERKAGERITALQLYGQAEQNYEKANEVSKQTNVLLKMCLLANMINNNSKQAKAYYEKARTLIPTRDDQHIEIKMGAILSRWGKFDLARFHYEKVEDICNKKRDKATLADVCRLRGIMEGTPKLENLEIAREYLEKAMEIYREIKDELGQAKVYQAKGDIEKENENYSTSVDYYLRAYSLYKESEDSSNKAIVMGELYKVQTLLENTEEALSWEKKIKKDYNDMPEKAQKYIDSILNEISNIKISKKDD